MLKLYYKRPEQINYLSLEAEEGIGVDELEIPHIEQTTNVLDLSEIIPEPTGSTLTEDQCQQLRNVIWKIFRLNFTYDTGEEPRPCVDYRNLNRITKTKFYPLPNIEERIETVSSAKYITVLDLSKGYWQIPMYKNAQRLSAFVTNFSTYIPLRMPFGLKNAPYEFSRMVAQLLEACEDFSVPYLDDIAVFSDMFQEHIKHLETVLQRIQQAGLTIKPSKCKFAQSQVQYF
ncbi:Transposon Ty3-I Gag-Pol polyprotein [Araneus ventricosus]|uniref:Transposon Ty3-I Gag-Pol polyprotein n=1 Tax=Araneus ventricosus TaxID=182803 RepID=A0A4Y2I8M1_ARAVE|nr:Transposon Ty3-I Gag-Pol polyprotein [Araneus ventricosus]